MFILKTTAANLTKKYETSKKIKEALTKYITPATEKVMDKKGLMYKRITIRELFY